MRLIKLFIVLFIAAIGHAQDLQVASIFSDHMVLQRGEKLPVWGKSAAKQKITVSFAGQIKATKSDKAGNWMVYLDPIEVSTIGKDMVIQGKTEQILTDIVVGEVWICSGQSNMQWETDKIPEVRGLVPFVKNIRSFEVERSVSFKEKSMMNGQWKAVHPSSAVAFSFAYFLEDLADVPVGIIHTSWGSSSLEAWMPYDMVEDVPHFSQIMEDFSKDTTRIKKIGKILEKQGDWETKEDIYLRRQPSILYNAMLHPLIPFKVRGMLWYQGERNTRHMSGLPEYDERVWFHQVCGMKDYGEVLQKWILNLRGRWGNPDMHFMVVMLPGFGKGTYQQKEIDPESPSELSWAWMRESQLATLSLLHTSVINTIDLGEVDNVHPKDKLPIGQRGALLGAKYTLGDNIEALGPKMSSVELVEDKIIVHFENATQLQTLDGKSPTAFWIANEDKKWVKAEAKIEEEQVVLSAPKLKNPKYVRYAFAGKPKVNLVNALGLPAYPFRTDKWDN
ncbi:sialate O-acetylesterase [Flavivirga aquimarina]|uniref:Sialate O-acetylesterase n=1 Tax=Flavivirga aquimarina TaxID=2027862 RepID=A0ABT8W6L7_9FLAO|nr:sialate O-acetylesterase [Flavivirga aquimarina]MDO5968759.1 sialate O-acetylesterase [Flavivirga aquimarina]